MKQLMIVLLGSLVVGCASTGDLEKANTKIADLEKKVAALEKKHEQVDPLKRLLGRRSNTNALRPSSVSTNTTFGSLREIRKQLVRARAKEAARREEERSAHEAERKVRKAQLQALRDQLTRAREEMKENEKRNAAERAKYAENINAFVKEYLGVQFGDSIEKFPEQKRPEPEDDYEEWELDLWERRELEHLALTPARRRIPVAKKFGYFDRANAWFLDGKLFYVELVACLDNKYSVESCDVQNQKALSNFVACVNLAQTDIVSWDSLFYVKARVCGLSNGKFLFDSECIDDEVRGDFCLGRSSEVREGGRYCEIGILNWRLGKECAGVVEKRKRTQGETLPEPK